MKKKKKSTVAETEITIRNRLGLHARPAALFVQLANKFRCDISVVKDQEEVNGKSIMGIMMLAAGEGTVLKIKATGPDADAAVLGITELIESNFGEEGDAV